MKRIVWLVLCIVGLSGCQNGQMNEILQAALSTRQEPLTQGTIVAGLREALEVGTQRAVADASKAGGFSASDLLRIQTPDELDNLEKTLRRIGMGSYVDQFEDKLNLAAEQAAAEAAPVFVQAIQEMTIQDAVGILQGADNAATEYFRSRTEPQIRQKMMPIINRHLGEVGAAHLYNDLVMKYNALPFAKEPVLNLEDYVAARTLDGLFSLVEKEEAAIRQDPVARTTDLLRRVFGAKQ